MRWASLILIAVSASLAFASVEPPQRKADWAKGVLDQAMSKVQGSAVVLDVESGRLIAGYRIEPAARRLIRPGSTIKPFVLLALMEAGIVNSETSLLCRTTVRLGGHRLDCSHISLPEPVTAVTALAYSCNYFFAHMSEHLPADSLVGTLVRSGFTSPSGLVRGETTGVVKRPAAREAVQLMAVGEDGVLVTPLGLAMAYRKLALQVRRSEQRLAVVVEGLQSAVQFGTAQLASAKGVQVAGKTGTATSGDGAGSQALFAGFAPAEKPEIVVVVFVERGSGGGDAAPIAQRVFEAYQ